MKKYLISENGNFYKANLHCHSNLSDGELTPEEMKKIYMERGYSIIAYTDHDIFIPHPELNDEKFLALNGFEMEINEERDTDFINIKTCHLCFIAIKPDNLNQICYHRTKYAFANSIENRKYVQFDDTKEDYERHFNPETINDIIKIGRENGFFVTYNHPTWSLEDYKDYINYEGMNAFEIYNHSSYSIGYLENNQRVYDDILRSGKRIFCIAADDNHNHGDINKRNYDSFGGFTMIKAPKLEYETITDALQKGDFYASEGPLINELYFEDGKIYVECSDADRIVLTVGRRRSNIVFAEDKPLNQASFDICPEDVYVRITVFDKEGKSANTNAYFTDELF